LIKLPPFVNSLEQKDSQAIIFQKLGIWTKGWEHVNLDHIFTPNDPTDLKNTTCMDCSY
jgi:hypothetical protein